MINLIHGDCLVVMPTITDQSVDLILADLPYSTIQLDWDKLIPLEPLWKEYKRIIKPLCPIVLFASDPFTINLAASNLAEFKYRWVWEKSVCGDCMNAKNKPMKKHEDILVFSSGTTANGSKRRMPYYPQGLVLVQRNRCGVDYGTTGGSFKQARPSHKAYVQEWEGYPHSILRYPHDKEKLAPTQKPVALLEYLIKTYTLEGQTVLDNTMGSGSCGVAAFNTNRSFIGIEKDDKYYKIGVDRINKLIEAKKE